MKFVNYASWIPSPNAALEIATAPFPQPDELEGDELIIKNKAVAINPIDWKIQSFPGNPFGLQYPYILGQDAAGEVLYVGEKIQHLFKKGDRVVAHTLTSDAAFKGFQLYVKLKAITTAKIPSEVSFEEAVVLPLSISTAAAGLYLRESLGLKLPNVPTGFPATAAQRGEVLLDADRETVLLWGGSSSVGSSVIQLAVASGYQVVATASPSNYDYVKSLGASLVLDYHNPDIVPIVTQLLRPYTLVGAYDAIGSETTVRQTAKIVQALGGGRITSVGVAPQDVEEDVEVTRVSAANLTTQLEVAKAVWGDYVPAALEAGTLLPRPKELIIGNGLYYIQGGLDLNKKGVSAAKVVITL